MTQPRKRVFVCSLAMTLMALALSQSSEGFQTAADSGALAGETPAPASTTTITTRLLSANAKSVAFGNVVPGKSSLHKLLLTNTGNTAVRISQVTTVGTGFKTSGLSLPATVAAGQSVILDITFTPATTGNFSGSIAVLSNATNSPARITLSGTGGLARISVVPSSVSFGSVPVGVTNTQTLTLSNPGSASLAVTQVTAQGAGFSLSGLVLPLSIAPGRSSSFNVRFTPAAAGTASGSLSIVSSPPNPPVTVALGGTGVAPAPHLAVNPALLSFGNISLGGNAAKTVTLSNTGNTNLSVSGIKVSGTGFSVSGFALPFTLAAGQSSSFTVAFAPAVTGSSAGSVSVSSTASSTASAVSLSGSGVRAVPHTVLLTWMPSKSNVVGYHVYRGAQTTGPYTRISPTVIAGTTYTDTAVQSSQSYFYVATAVDSAGLESVYSNEIPVVVP
jgi:hypothetical protein